MFQRSKKMIIIFHTCHNYNEIFKPFDLHLFYYYLNIYFYVLHFLLVYIKPNFNDHMQAFLCPICLNGYLTCLRNKNYNNVYCSSITSFLPIFYNHWYSRMLNSLIAFAQQIILLPVNPHMYNHTYA